MEIYSTEEQQVQAIKDWWKKNGTSVIIGAVVGLSAVFGWRYYGNYQVAQKEAASDAYQAAVTQYAESGEAQDVSALNEYVMASPGGNNYAVFAALMLAKQHVDAADYAAAEQQLTWAVANAPEELKGMLTLRLARVQAQLENYDAALASLSAIAEPALQASVELARGDIYFAQDNKELARQAYQAAVSAGGNELDPSLPLKLNDLAEADANG